MKFSILIPTRNRLEFLKMALHSVIAQDYSDWEVIVSDNASEQDVAGYIHSLQEPRIKYFRTEQFVSVTENWNSALEKNSGDYVLMIGDDDCLMKGYFTTVLQLLKKYPEPDLIYTSGFLYAYPGVMPGHPNGFLTVHGNAGFLEGKKEPFWLKKQEAIDLVHAAMDFRVKVSFNAQYALIHRSLIEKMHTKGSFYQTPYPDYYAMLALLLSAEKILACPFPLVLIAICPKSFGFFYFNQREADGAEFLKNPPEHTEQKHLQKEVLPGTKMNTFWLFSMEEVRKNYKETFPLKLNYKRYRFLQILKSYKRWALTKERNVLKELWQKMRWREKGVLGTPYLLLGVCLRCIPLPLRSKIANRLDFWSGSHPSFHPQKIEKHFTSALEVFEKIDWKEYELN